MAHTAGRGRHQQPLQLLVPLLAAAHILCACALANAAAIDGAAKAGRTWSTPGSAGEQTDSQSGVNAQLDRALYLRRDGAPAHDLKAAAELLFELAGVQAQRKASARGVELPQGSVPVPGFPGLFFTSYGSPAAMRELAKSLQAGRGVAPSLQLPSALYARAAELGDAEAQGQMGLRFTFGLHVAGAIQGNAVRRFGEPDEPAALLHYYFGAMSGDPLSLMALGYRHAFGLGVPQSCWTAVGYYKPVAEAALRAAIAPGSGLPLIERIRLNVMDGPGGTSRGGEDKRELVAYFQYSADHGNHHAQREVGRVLNMGTYGVDRDHAAAMHYLQRAAAAGDADAMAHLAHMHAAGLGSASGGAGGAAPSEADAAAALKWFRASASKKKALGLYGLGYLYLTGRGVTANMDKAASYLQEAADLGSPDALYVLGAMHLTGNGVRRKSARRAYELFRLAATANHAFAMYNQAAMLLEGRGGSVSPRERCSSALLLLKSLAESGPWAGALQAGHEAFFRGAYGRALLNYLAAAEMGMELGASNAAWMLGRGYGHAGPGAPAAALLLTRRSAEQGNVASLLMLGDAYFYGVPPGNGADAAAPGVPGGVRQNWTLAAAVYYEAYHAMSPEAAFNIGLCHEFGIGVPRDLALARRFYAIAGARKPDAALTVLLADTWLAGHILWDNVSMLLPPRAGAAMRSLLQLHPPHTSLLRLGSGFGLGAATAASALRRVMLHWDSLSWRLAGLWTALRAALASGGGGSGQMDRVPGGGGGVDADGGDAGSELGDMGETVLLAALLGVLYLVMRIRRQRAQVVAARVQAGLQQGDPRAQQIAVQLGMAVPTNEQPSTDGPASMQQQLQQPLREQQQRQQRLQQPQSLEPAPATEEPLQQEAVAGSSSDAASLQAPAMADEGEDSFHEQDCRVIRPANDSGLTEGQNDGTGPDGPTAALGMEGREIS